MLICRESSTLLTAVLVANNADHRAAVGRPAGRRPGHRGPGPDHRHRTSQRRTGRCLARQMRAPGRRTCGPAGQWPRSSIMLRNRMAASSMSECLFRPALDSAESTPQRCTLAKSPYGYLYRALVCSDASSSRPRCQFAYHPAVGLDEVVFLTGRWLVLAPVVPLIQDHLAVLDLVLREFE